MTTDTKEIQRIVRKHYEQLYANKLEDAQLMLMEIINKLLTN